MAERIQQGETFTVAASGDFDLGDAAEGIHGTIVVQLVGNMFNGSVTPKARVVGVADASDFLAVAYRDATTEEVVQAGTAVSNPSNEIIEVSAGGREVRLSVVRNSGSLEITFQKLLG